jgi:hypothetical protein
MITYPMSLPAFFGGLRVASCTFSLPEALQFEETGGGEVVTAALGVRLWQGEVTLAADHHGGMAAAEAAVSAVREAGASFFAFPSHKPAPAVDPDGRFLGASVPQIASLPSARSLSLSGLPAGYVISAGDFLSFAYGTPARFALHQVVIGGAAGAAGVTGEMAVTPAIRPGAVVGAAVALVRPFARVRYLPGSLRPASYGPAIGQGLSFSFRQTLGA